MDRTSAVSTSTGARDEPGDRPAAVLPGLGLLDLRGCDVAVIVAHPDDETIALGGQLATLEQVTIVHVTDGAPRDMRDAAALGFASREEYARARRSELEAAMGEVGIGCGALLGLGIVDQEAALQLPDLTRRLAALFGERGTRLAFTHAYEGGHPDHDAVCFCVHAAARLMRRQGLRPPVLIDMPFYHAGAAGLTAQRFAELPAAPHLTLMLDDAAWIRKQRALALHATQQRTLAAFYHRFEQFRRAPDYDFAVLPNGGDLYYERFPWGIDGAAWRRLAGDAVDALGLAP